MKFGAEPRKLIMLGVLGVVLIYVLFFNSSGDQPQQTTRTGPSVTAPRPAVAPPTVGGPVAQKAKAPARRPGERVLQEFRPSLKPKRPEDRADPMTIDPTLRTEVFAKLQTVNVSGPRRSIFEFTAEAPPPNAVAKVDKKPPVPSPLTQQQQPAQPAAPPPPPPPPPIPLKFYGFISAANQAAGPKRAFFLDGEDIHVVTEGDTVKKRYKVVRIGVNTVTVEDIQFKNTQTLPLEEQPAG
ncbi:MAG TPA: hypothetical protein VE621_17145 [Bryobacteraceae bacterium]|nr:hypothetical protein [Bryobacteraceae bacterium]